VAFPDLNLRISFWERRWRGLKECTPFPEAVSSELPKESIYTVARQGHNG
jgi:hypothetical protein